MNQPPSSLEQLSEQFARWRQTRSSSQQATPLSLRQQAVKLKDAYPKRLIVTSLGINHSTLKRWSAEQLQPHQRSTFVELDESVGRRGEVIAAPTRSVVCQLPNGIDLTFDHSALTPDLLSMLIHLHVEVSS